jgi:hypothetical protein
VVVHALVIAANELVQQDRKPIAAEDDQPLQIGLVVVSWNQFPSEQFDG